MMAYATSELYGGAGPAVGKTNENNLIRIPFRIVAVATVLLPLTAFIFCIVWSLVFDFEESTSTHCRVNNYLPSISAAIGGFVPQKYVWRVAIGLHAAPRFMIATMYRGYYQKLLIDEALWRLLATIVCILHIFENSSLIGLTYISSSEYYPAHEKCFITFIVCSLTYMLLSCSLPRIAAKKVLSIQELQSLQVKSLLALFNIMGSLSAAFFFMRHNNFCEPGMYTMFALSEYVVVLTNMSFHMAAYWDFKEFQLSVAGLLSPPSHKGARILYP